MELHSESDIEKETIQESRDQGIQNHKKEYAWNSNKFDSNSTLNWLKFYSDIAFIDNWILMPSDIHIDWNMDKLKGQNSKVCELNY